MSVERDKGYSKFEWASWNSMLALISSLPAGTFLPHFLPFWSYLKYQYASWIIGPGFVKRNRACGLIQWPWKCFTLLTLKVNQQFPGRIPISTNLGSVHLLYGMTQCYKNHLWLTHLKYILGYTESRGLRSYSGSHKLLKWISQNIVFWSILCSRNERYKFVQYFPKHCCHVGIHVILGTWDPSKMVCRNFHALNGWEPNSQHKPQVSYSKKNAIL